MSGSNKVRGSKELRGIWSSGANPGEFSRGSGILPFKERFMRIENIIPTEEIDKRADYFNVKLKPKREAGAILRS